MGHHTPDEQLARGARAGRLEDFEALVHRYRDRVYRICFRMAGNVEDAEDWAQECFVRTYKNLGSYNPALPFAPWLLRVVTNTCINLARSRLHQRSKVEFGLEEQNRAADTPDPLHATVSREEARQVNAAVAALPASLRQAITLRIVDGLSFRELAEALEVPLQTAASRVRRALLQIRGVLEKTESEVEK